MLTISDVNFSFPNQPVFEGLNLKINPGDFAFIIGKSGIGKSTLFQLIFMNLLPGQGTVDFDGFSSETIDEASLPHLRRKLGVVFQDFKLLEDRNVYDNVAFVLQVTGVPSRKIKKKVLNVLSEVGLSNKAKNKTSELSGGERQRVAIARAIVNDPLLILADEPTGNLDSETTAEIMDIFKRINNRGTAILFATHDYDIVKQNDSKIYKIHDGRIVKVVLKKKKVSSNYSL